MNQTEVVNLLSHAMLLVAKTAGPILLASLVVGLAVSVFQALTQINDYTLTFAPKLLAIAVVLIVTGPWIISQLTNFTSGLYNSIPHLIGGG